MPALRVTRILSLSGIAILAVALGVSHQARSESAVPSAPAGAVVASYRTGQITQSELEAVIAQKLPQERKKIAEPGGREALLQSILRYDLLAQEAERRGYASHPAVVQSVRRSASERMLAERLKVDPKDVAASELEQAYQARVHQFARPRMLRASQIQVATQAEAQALRSKTKPGDRAGFAKLAREYSSDARSQRQGGELGYFDAEGKLEGTRESGIPPAIVKAAFALKQGEVSPPIAHDAAFSLVMLTGEMAAVTPKRAAIEAKLREELAQAQRQRDLEALLAQLRAEAKPEIHPELLDQIVLPPITPLDYPQGFAAAPPDPRAPPRLVPPDEY